MIESIDIEFGHELQEYYFYYKSSNLKDYNNRTAYDKICSVYDRMSEYVLFSDHELDDIIEDENGFTAKDRKRIYTFTQESNLKTMQSKNDISLDTYIYTMSNGEGMNKKKYDDQNHATYTLKDFENRIDECPYVKGYMEFNKHARRIIESLDKQISEHEENGINIKDIDKLTYTNDNGKKFTYTPQQLSMLKKGIGYSKNNSREIDQDIMAIYREWFRPIFFNSVARSEERRRKIDLDFMDKEHIAGLIKASCLTGQFSKFDEYVEKLDKLVKQTNLTELELQVYNILRKGKGLDLDKEKYECNMITITECAKILGVSQPRAVTIFDSLADKVADKYEELYEDYYFTYIARGTYKKCSKCEEIKLANERYFSPKKDGKDGLQAFCKKCDAERKKS